jgi:uncharacterized integral membrane protein (TIGR00698 family)
LSRVTAAAPVLPGLVLAALLALLSHGAVAALTSGVLPFDLPWKKAPIPPVLVAIVLGLVIRNAVGLPAAYQEGLRFGMQRVLRIGVALLGLRLGLGAVGSLGLIALPVVVATITTALVIVNLVTRAMGLPQRLGVLIAVGTAICGNSAIVATAPAIDAEEDEISYAVGCVTLFGLIALLTYPFLAHLGFSADPRLAGVFLGTAIHDTAQVIGAGMLYVQQYAQPEALDAATVTKLLRNTFMVAVIPGMALLHRHRLGEHGVGAKGRPHFTQAVPLFVLGFLGFVALRTLGDATLGAESMVWSAGVGLGSTLSSWCLTIAMAAVGLGTDLRKLRGLGLKPLAVGFAAAAAVGAMSAGLLNVLPTG